MCQLFCMAILDPGLGSPGGIGLVKVGSRMISYVRELACVCYTKVHTPNRGLKQPSAMTTIMNAWQKVFVAVSGLYKIVIDPEKIVLIAFSWLFFLFINWPTYGCLKKIAIAATFSIFTGAHRKWLECHLHFKALMLESAVYREFFQGSSSVDIFYSFSKSRVLR